MNNKHHAAWAVIALLLVFLAIVIWRVFISPTPHALAPGDVATTTPSSATSIPPIVITDSGRYHDAEAKYPGSTPLSATAGASADAEAVALMKAFAENSIASFRESAEAEMPGIAQTFGEDRKYTMGIEYTAAEGPKTVSYIYLIYQDTLGAHPNAYYRTFTFDRATGHVLSLDELFASNAPYLERISARVRADLPAIMARRAETTPDQVDRDYINTGTMPIADSFNNFAIEGHTLRMIFPPYQVGPYAYGTIEVPIPLSGLSDILNAKYRP